MDGELRYTVHLNFSYPGISRSITARISNLPVTKENDIDYSKYLTFITIHLSINTACTCK